MNLYLHCEVYIEVKLSLGMKLPLNDISKIYGSSHTKLRRGNLLKGSSMNFTLLNENNIPHTKQSLQYVLFSFNKKQKNLPFEYDFHIYTKINALIINSTYLCRTQSIKRLYKKILKAIKIHYLLMQLFLNFAFFRVVIDLSTQGYQACLSWMGSTLTNACCAPPGE